MQIDSDSVVRKMSFTLFIEFMKFVIMLWRRDDIFVSIIDLFRWRYKISHISAVDVTRCGIEGQMASYTVLSWSLVVRFSNS